MKKFSFYIPRQLPGFNEIIEWSKQPVPWLSKPKKRVYIYTIKKKEVQGRIISDIYRQYPPFDSTAELPKFESCRIDFKWFEANRRRDPSNVCAGGRKFILDALVSIQVLKNDNWLLRDFIDVFIVDKSQTGVEVNITEI